LIAWSKQLDKGDIAELLGNTLTEEKAADEQLTSIAESAVNLRAAM
jgi:ferritin-like metal-binding protein YciE